MTKYTYRSLDEADAAYEAHVIACNGYPTQTRASFYFEVDPTLDAEAITVLGRFNVDDIDPLEEELDEALFAMDEFAYYVPADPYTDNNGWA